MKKGFVRRFCFYGSLFILYESQTANKGVEII